MKPQNCPCGLDTCVEPWEPGCGLGNSPEHAVRVDIELGYKNAAYVGYKPPPPERTTH